MLIFPLNRVCISGEHGTGLYHKFMKSENAYFKKPSMTDSEVKLLDSFSKMTPDDVWKKMRSMRDHYTVKERLFLIFNAEQFSKDDRTRLGYLYPYTFPDQNIVEVYFSILENNELPSPVLIKDLLGSLVHLFRMYPSEKSHNRLVNIANRILAETEPSMIHLIAYRAILTTGVRSEDDENRTKVMIENESDIFLRFIMSYSVAFSCGYWHAFEECIRIRKALSADSEDFPNPDEDLFLTSRTRLPSHSLESWNDLSDFITTNKSKIRYCEKREMFIYTEKE